MHSVFDLSKKQLGSRNENRSAESANEKEVWERVFPSSLEEGSREVLCPLCRKFLIFFSKYFTIGDVYSGAFSYTTSKVLFTIKCSERYVITVFLATDGDTDMKTLSFHQSSKLIPIQSVNSNSRRFHSYSRHVL